MYNQRMHLTNLANANFRKYRLLFMFRAFIQVLLLMSAGR